MAQKVYTVHHQHSKRREIFFKEIVANKVIIAALSLEGVESIYPNRWRGAKDPRSEQTKPMQHIKRGQHN